jgi:predicted DCC family thiol-disulfide oxidoreductase YuxK
MGTIDKVNSSVILFDGVCNLCNSSINFVIDRDKHKKYKFASLQSQFGQQLAATFGKDIDMQSVLLFENGKVMDKSDAALEIAKNLTGAWPLFYVFKLIPPFLRNAVYNFISKNRYRWFGKQEFCRMPSPELKSLFLS